MAIAIKPNSLGANNLAKTTTEMIEESLSKVLANNK